MSPDKKIAFEERLQELRRAFAQRMRVLIEQEDREPKAKRFSERTGISERQISQWRDPRQINWPSTESLIRLIMYADVSPTWLLIGLGYIKRSVVERRVEQQFTYEGAHPDTLINQLINEAAQIEYFDEEAAKLAHALIDRIARRETHATKTTAKKDIAYIGDRASRKKRGPGKRNP